VENVRKRKEEENKKYIEKRFGDEISMGKFTYQN